MQLDIPYHLENFIDGDFFPPLKNDFLDNVNPATGLMVGKIPNSTAEDVETAVIAAKKHFQIGLVPAQKKDSVFLIA
jgi:aminomuconate-semialdehyde/2-hydroxymuconate-6-semialdehyde dehydrogenase